MSVSIRWVCTYCGQRVTRFETQGRPQPGICYKKGKTKDGRPKPHTWVKD